MKHMNVDIDVVLDTAHRVRSEAQDLAEELSKLEREWSNVSHGWSGSAASAYRALWEEWHEGATKVVDMVADSTTKLSHAAVLYWQQDAESAQSLQSAAASIPSDSLADEMGL